jgi:cytochrome c peroxidase
MINKKSKIIFLAIGVLIIALNSCKKDTIKDPVTETPLQQDNTPYTIDNGAFPSPVIAGDNALTVQGVLLGRMLFYEKTLSKNNMIACANCHKQEFAFDDTSRFSVGVLGLKGKRQAMAIFNTAWHTNEFFWDGRAHFLRDQSLKPIQDTLEMFETLPSIIAKLSTNQAYKNQFVRTFGSEEINSVKISLALEQFMNSIVSNNSKYDKYLANTATLTASEDNGRKLFFAQYNPFFPATSGADCAHCHSSFNFTNNDYINNGLDTDASITDKGREKVTNNSADRAKFKVPSLRNIALTAPYMHDGRFKTLEEVVDHYNSGLKASTYIDPALENTRALGLMLNAQQKIDLVNFLKTLTDNSLTTNPKYASPF